MRLIGGGTAAAAVVLVAGLACAEAISVVVDERAVLLEFYQATGGEAWNNNFGWSEASDDVCEWHGVICEEDDLESNNPEYQARRKLDSSSSGKVLGISLASNFVTGRVPDSFWSLPALEELNLSYNPHLDVNFSGLREYSETQKLRILKLHETGTTSLVGISSASETLEQLVMSQSKLNTPIPQEIYDLSHLTSLHMAECQLQGTIPDQIHKLSLLRELNFFRNMLTGQVPDGMRRMSHMRHMTLSFNQLHGTLPTFFDDMFLLQQFWAEFNDLTGTIPAFDRNPELFKLYLNGNSFSGELPVTFLKDTLNGPKLGPLRINLSNNELGGPLPVSLDQLQDMEGTFYLGDNRWTELPDQLCDNTKWNQGAIQAYGCPGLLCPPGTYNRFGFRTPDHDCQSCSTGQYWGATSCFDKDDRSVLTELFVALSGEGWERADNWLDTSDYCSWYGVTCWDTSDSKRGRVRKLELPNNGLKGDMPDTIFSMHHLTTIDVSRNDVVFSFRNIGNSEHMFHINIAATLTNDFDGIEMANTFFHELYADQLSIGGTFPHELTHVDTLNVLSLQECDLNGEIPSKISRMNSLQELYLTGNNLRGTIPDIFNEMNELQILALAKNQLTGTLPDTLGQGLNLIAVSLQDQITKGGGLSGPLKDFGQAPKLRRLLLGSNKLEGEIPENLMAGYEGDGAITIDISNNLVSGPIPGVLDRFSILNLYVENNMISSIDDNLCRQEDWMHGNVKDYGCDAILCPAGYKGGRHRFSDEGCQECDSRGSGVAFLGQANCLNSERLTERDILELLYTQCGGLNWHSNNNWMSESAICDWYGIDCDESGSVSSITLNNNQLVGSFPTEVFSLPSLTHLKLYSNTLYFNFDGIDAAKNLQSLHLDNTGLDSLNGLGKARSLRELNLGFNKLSGPIPEELSRLINLRELVLSNNNLQGYIPYWMRSLQSLSTLDMSHNQLEGPLYDFAPFDSLIFLDLSHNKLSGPVPPSFFSNLDENEKAVADLSYNHLTGTVPGELERLQRITLQLKGNKIDDIDPKLCEVEGWNNFDVSKYGCDGILCPPGKYNPTGRQSSDESPCKHCKDKGKKYYGSTTCSGAAGVRALSSLGLAAVATVAYLLL
jgi:Leucine-rich repeat (LRR) protein